MGFQLAITNIAWAGENDHDVYKMMNRYRFTGLEIAPTRMLPHEPYEQLEAAKNRIQKLKEDYGLTVPSMQSIWYGRQENLFASDADRQTLRSYTQRAINFASACGISNLVFGCPKNRNMPEGADPATGILFFKEIAQYAEDRGCVIGLEANPPMYHTNYINTTADALRMVDELSCRGLQLNLDLGTVIANQESLDILKGHMHRIHHVHISEPGLGVIVRRPIHDELAKLLRGGGYQGWVSVEMGRTDSLSVLEDTMCYIQRVFGDVE